MTVFDNILLEGDLRAGKQAHRYGQISDSGETASDGVVELRRYQLVSDPCRPGREQVQTDT